MRIMMVKVKVPLNYIPALLRHIDYALLMIFWLNNRTRQTRIPFNVTCALMVVQDATGTPRELAVIA